MEVVPMTVPLATRIDAKAKAILNKLHKKTHIPIRQLTEKAIFLLDDHYKQMSTTYTDGAVDSMFAQLVDYSLKKHHATYKKLAE